MNHETHLNLRLRSSEKSLLQGGGEAEAMLAAECSWEAAEGSGRLAKGGELADMVVWCGVDGLLEKNYELSKQRLVACDSVPP